jgi:hypothetical protein
VWQGRKLQDSRQLQRSRVDFDTGRRNTLPNAFQDSRATTQKRIDYDSGSGIVDVEELTYQARSELATPWERTAPLPHEHVKIGLPNEAAVKLTLPDRAKDLLDVHFPTF